MPSQPGLSLYRAARRIGRLLPAIVFFVFLYFRLPPSFLRPDGLSVDDYQRLTYAYIVLRIVVLGGCLIALAVFRKSVWADIRFYYQQLKSPLVTEKYPLNWSRIPQPDLIGISTLYFLIRIWRLMILPGFTDEVISARWVQLISRGHVFVSFIFNGKKPLYFWLGAITHSLGVDDPILALRITSLLTGWCALAGLMIIAYRFADRRTALIVGLLFAVSPYSFFYSRIGLIDMTVTAGLVLVVLTSLSMLRPGSSRLTVLWVALSLGASFLTKTYAYPFAIMPVLLLGQRLLVERRRPQAWELARIGSAIALGGALLLVVVHAAGAPLFDKESPNYYLSAAGSLAAYLLAVWRNVGWLAGNFVKYIGWPVMVLAGVELVYSLFRPRKSFLAGSLFLFVIWGMFVAVAKVHFPRYVLFSLPILLLLAGMFIGRLTRTSRLGTTIKSVLLTALLLLIAIPNLIDNYRLLKDPTTARTIDTVQFVTDWSAGYGAMDVVNFLERESRQGPLTVFIAFDVPQTSYPEIYLEGNPNVALWGISWIREKPVLHFLAAGEPAMGAREVYLRRDEPIRIDPQSRLLTIANGDFIREDLLLSLNPGSRVIFRAPRPGNLFAMSVVELARPVAKQQAEE